MKPRRALAATAFVSLGLSCGFHFAVAQDKMAALQAQFDRENDSIRKEKLFRKLSEALFEQAHSAGRQHDFQRVGLLMEKYRDNLHEALTALKRQHPDAEKHPGGFRDLEIRVRGGLRELDDILLVAPEEFRPPLGLVRKDVGDMEDELLRLLFPRRPGEKPVPQPPKPK